jgi:glycosyltransferase involved in cell wall biosynthesis
LIETANPPTSERTRADSPGQSLRAPIRAVMFDHTAQLGGGEIALYDLVRFLDRSLVTPIVVLGAEGPLAEKLRGLSATGTAVELYILPLADEVLHAKKDALGTGTLLQFRKVTSSISYIFRLRAFLRKHKADLIHTNSLKADILGGLAGRLAGVPVLWHIRDRIEPDYLPSKVVWLMRKLARILPKYVVANSTATLATVHLDGKIPGATVSSGVDMTKFELPSDSQMPIKETNASAPKIGIVGRLCPWKGQHIFLEAAAIVRRQWPAACFQIIGAALFQEKHLEADLKAQAADLGLADAVEFTGFRSDVNLLIQQLTILVHASTTGEPFGQVIVQGMAASKPVVATNGGGVPEIVVDGVTGYLVPMSDATAMAAAISALLSSPTEAAEMGRRGRERIFAKFTIQSSARTLEGVYAAVINPVRR